MNTPTTPARCGWDWIGETGYGWHRCNRPAGHSGWHAENGRTFNADEPADPLHVRKPMVEL